MSVNGSTVNALCSNITVNGTESTCNAPNSSVLFDGNIPTLTGLDGDMWASQLFTLQPAAPSTELTFGFTEADDNFGVETVEVVLFNCQERGISVSTITLLEIDSGMRLNVGSLNVSTVSCDSLIRVCFETNLTIPLLGIQFELAESSDQVYLAEVIFDGTESPCPASVTVLNGSMSTTEPSAVTTSADAAVTTSGSITPEPQNTGVCIAPTGVGVRGATLCVLHFINTTE